MKKVQPLIVLLLLFLATLTNGQSAKNSNTYFEVMVNMVSTNIYYGEENSSLADYKKSVNGIQAGVSFQAGISDAFSLVSELYFIRKGGKLKAGNPLTQTASSLYLNSIELPVLARLHLGKFYINAGPSLAYNLSGYRKNDDKSSRLSFSNDSEGFKRLDAGIQVGGGFMFPLKQKRIALDIRYVHGITQVSHGQDIYNRALMVSVHVSKPWKSKAL